MSVKFKIPVHIEVEIKGECTLSTTSIVSLVSQKLQAICPIFQNGIVYFNDLDLNQHIDQIKVCDLPSSKRISFWQAELRILAFRMSDQGPENDFLEGEEELPAAEQWELPNANLSGLWDSIIVDEVIKNRLLSYCSSSIQFSESRIDPNIISWNRMALLHGPPGTGKTTICKALAQKMFIRNCDRYSSGILLEVNSHSLFSKWFSESGKLVMKLFSHIAEIADDEECLVVILIDEIESITSARSSSSRSNEPGDAVRVVNAVLTSLDSLKRRSNVLLLCTSNMQETVDPAFLDRVDLKVYLGPPSLQARYMILHSCLTELTNKGIIITNSNTTLSDDMMSVINSYVSLIQQSYPSLLNSNSNSNSNSNVNNRKSDGNNTSNYPVATAVDQYIETLLVSPKLQQLSLQNNNNNDNSTNYSLNSMSVEDMINLFQQYQDRKSVV